MPHKKNWRRKQSQNQTPPVKPKVGGAQLNTPWSTRLSQQLKSQIDEFIDNVYSKTDVSQEAQSCIIKTNWHNDQSLLMTLVDNSDKTHDLKSLKIDIQSTDLCGELNLKNIEHD